MNLFIFHNDLRLEDNTGLKEAMEAGKTIPVFIFTPQQIGNGNKFKSEKAIEFMKKSLDELSHELKKHGSKLHIFYGDTATIVRKLIKQYKITGVYSNHNYTPFAINRDKAVQKVCDSLKVEFHEYEDYILYPIDSVSTSSGAYRKYTPFLNTVSGRKVEKPRVYRIKNLISVKSSGGVKGGEIGGRKQGLSLLKKVHSNYGKTRNLPHIDTTHLSAYIKFGCISPREAYHEFKKHGHDLVKQLIWRDFYIHLVYGYPHVLVGKNRNFKEKYSEVKWVRLNNGNKNTFMKWCKGETGFPIVDAAMRQLNETGWMHNRGRLITAWFLTKVMGWHWMYGEIYFAKHLIDYDPAVNNGNWQFCAGSGVDTDQYFRLFNPWAQSEKYDTDALYIKKWIPQLKMVPAKHLHNWYKFHTEYKVKYPKPILDYEKSKDHIKTIYGRY
jgi:deoxyribodipyrimidine photo-lyase